MNLSDCCESPKNRSVFAHRLLQTATSGGAEYPCQFGFATVRTESLSHCGNQCHFDVATNFASALRSFFTTREDSSAFDDYAIRAATDFWAERHLVRNAARAGHVRFLPHSDAGDDGTGRSGGNGSGTIARDAGRSAGGVLDVRRADHVWIAGGGLVRRFDHVDS